MDYSLLKALIEHVEQYEVEGGEHRLEDFMIWLNNRLFSAKEAEGHSAHDELLIAFKLMHIHKDLKKQTKSILSPSLVSSLDEYSFLLHLDHQDSFRKMEIVELHRLEAPTGIEIIRRLLRNKLVEEFPDEEDRRAKRIKITTKGREELRDLQPKIVEVFTHFTEPLSLNERIQLSGVLDKLL